MKCKILGIIIGLMIFPGVVYGADTICSVDDDFNGTIDFWCPAPDGDHDGYATDGSGVETGTDCDDHDRFDYVGVAVGCNVATGTKNQTNPDGWKVCQSNGTYTTCTANSTTPYCPSGCLSCKYWDAGSGNDSNPGTYASPYQTAAKFTSLTFSAGSCNFLKAGTYTDQLLIATSEDGTAVNRNKLENYPGHTPVLTPNKRAINLSGGAYWDIAGFEVTGNNCRLGADSVYDGGCVALQEMPYVNVSRMHIHDNRTNRTGNGNGLLLHGCTSPIAHHNVIYGNYDETTTPKEGIGILAMRGTNYLLHHNVLLTRLAEESSRPFFNKHANYSSSYTLRDNITSGYVTNAIAGRQVTLQRNLFLVTGISNSDNGGLTYTGDWLVEDNTFESTSLFLWNPTFKYNETEVSGGDSNLCFGEYIPGDVVFRRNVFLNDGGAWTGERAVYNIHTYGPDGIYARVWTAGIFKPSDSCYFKAGVDFQANVFASNNGNTDCSSTARGNNGQTYSTFASWVSASGETGSYYEDPQLDIYHRATSTNCADKGWLVAGAPASSSSSSAPASSSSSSSSTVSSFGAPAYNFSKFKRR